MNAKYIVISAECESATVTPVEDASSCASCGGNCAKCSVRFSVGNTRKLPVKAGDTVKIGMSAKHEALQGILSLAFPVLCAVAGYFTSPRTASLFGRAATEGWKAASVLVFLAAACAVVLIITRRRPNPERLEITEIC
jgi:hypothetical protein